MVILLTGAAGFIGMSTAEMLLKQGHKVIGIDNLNDYYSVSLKKARIENISQYKNFTFIKANIFNLDEIKTVFQKFSPSILIHLAAQAGVRYSVQNPQAYVDSNLHGFMNILECSRLFSIKHLIYASSSSVYGGNTKLPFSEADNVDHPVSLYAATKKANELMAHTYSHLFNLPTTGLRFFTVYGPWGRPDMSPYLFSRAILDEEPLKIFNNGNMRRDFTYIDDVATVISKLIDKPAFADPKYSSELPSPPVSSAPYRIFNVGASNSYSLIEYIELLEKTWGKSAAKIFLPIQAGDVQNTFADTHRLNEWIDYTPNTTLNDGIKNYVQWFKKYYTPST